MKHNAAKTIRNACFVLATVGLAPFAQAADGPNGTPATGGPDPIPTPTVVTEPPVVTTTPVVVTDPVVTAVPTTEVVAAGEPKPEPVTTTQPPVEEMTPPQVVMPGMPMPGAGEPAVAYSLGHIPPPMPGEGEPPIAYSMGRGGDDPLPYERTMTVTSEMPDVPVLNKTEDAVSALPSVTADAVSAVAALENQTAISAPADTLPVLDATQVVGSAGEALSTGAPAIRNGHLSAP